MCYTHIPVQKRRKRDEKAITGCLFRYDGDERYRIYDKETRVVIYFREM